MSKLQALTDFFCSVFRAKESDYQKRVSAEVQTFKHCENVHELPDIFHYWSNKYLLPMMQPFGFTNPNDFFFLKLRNLIGDSPNSFVRIASIGSGNCDLEVELAKKLAAHGHQDFVFDCLDINPDMLDRGSRLAEAEGVGKHISPICADFNAWKPKKHTYRAILANQSLHHVLNLEGLFRAIQYSLDHQGKLLVSDMIGRNGHMRWPEALELVEEFWQELPEQYRYNHLMDRLEISFINHDCSTEGFEGIRAQDILPLLVQNFSFEFFLPFGNVIFPFVDRAFGHNYNANEEWDKQFIDRVHAADENAILEHKITPTSMLAVLSMAESKTTLRHPNLTPAECIRVVDFQRTLDKENS